jgi:hypothetical protein
MVMLMDPDGRQLWPASAPRLPGDFVKAISPLMIGENTGSCGTAAFRKERVILSDLATDSQMSDLPAGMGLRAQWSRSQARIPRQTIESKIKILHIDKHADRER